MPPKGSGKPKSMVQARTSAPPLATEGRSKGLVIELAGGEKDAQNLSFHTQVLEAMEVISDKFPGIVEKGPLAIADGGAQAPFKQRDLEQALRTPGGSYICGINLAWLNHTFSATPGVPARKSAVDQVASTVFAKPTLLEQLHVAVPSVEYKVAEHKGSFMRVSPEEITAAYFFAVARDIGRHEPSEILQEWEKCILSTTCKFVLLPGQMDRYWYALARREDIDHTFQAVHRSCFQRVWEVARLASKLGDLVGSTNVTAERIYQEYKTNLTNMNKDAVAAITLNFCDVAATVNHRMLQVPELVRILRDLDGMPRTVFNPFDSHSRLQAIINKCKTQESLIYCCQALEYMALKDELPGLSVEDIKGRSKDGNKGELDLILFKQKVRLALIAKGLQWFEDSPGAKWIQDEVATKTQDFVVWAATERG